MQSKKVTEEDLRREFEVYGNIERIRLVLDRKGKSKSYAFIVYERERDMKGESRARCTLSPADDQLRTRTRRVSLSTTRRFSSMWSVGAQSRSVYIEPSVMSIAN
jgi:hypothetical protein